jgi:hypothetical protein
LKRTGLAITAVHGANLSNLKLSELLTKRVTNGASKGATSNGNQKEIAPSFDFRCEENNKTFKPKTGLSAFQVASFSLILIIEDGPELNFFFGCVDPPQDISRSRITGPKLSYL